MYVVYPQVTMDDFEVSCKGLFRALTIREKYMRLAYQRFPQTASQYLRNIEGETFNPEDQLQPGGKRLHIMVKNRFVCLFFLMIRIHPSVFTSLPKAGEDPFDTKTLPENLGYVTRMKKGLIYVYNDAAAADKHQPKDLPCPDYDTFIDDMNFLIALIAQGPT